MVPPLVGVAVNVAVAPAHSGLLPAVCAIAIEATEQGVNWKENIWVFATPEAPMYSLVCQKVTPSGSRVKSA